MSWLAQKHLTVVRTTLDCNNCYHKLCCPCWCICHLLFVYPLFQSTPQKVAESLGDAQERLQQHFPRVQCTDRAGPSLPTPLFNSERVLFPPLWGIPDSIQTLLRPQKESHGKHPSSFPREKQALLQRLCQKPHLNLPTPFTTTTQHIPSSVALPRSLSTDAEHVTAESSCENLAMRTRTSFAVHNLPFRLSPSSQLIVNRQPTSINR